MILASVNLHGGRRADGTPFDVVAACRQLDATWSCCRGLVADRPA